MLSVADRMGSVCVVQIFESALETDDDAPVERKGKSSQMRSRLDESATRL